MKTESLLRTKDDNEEYLVRKVAGLLYVPQPRFIAAKLRVERELAK